MLGIWRSNLRGSRGESRPASRRARRRAAAARLAAALLLAGAGEARATCDAELGTQVIPLP
ncbi:MAG TPA: hypothetical protein VFP65_16615, partial [Anaeromyxobacteraceae bacterium]|nr:hypothetical protein [Anaeromyxobacteraceae bacterium]